MTLTFYIHQRDEQSVLSIRTFTSMRDLPETILHGLARVSQVLTKAGILPSDPAFVGYYNLDIHEMAVEIGYPVKFPVRADGDVISRTIPGGLAGVCHYTGPYQELATAYQQLNAYIESQGREPTGVSYEFYLNDPTVTPPNELRTEIVFPLIETTAREQARPSGNGRIHSLY